MRGTSNRALRVTAGIALLALLIAVAAVAAFAHSGRAAVRHTMTPFSAGQTSKYQAIGAPSIAGSSLHFNCQLASPPVGPCYGPDEIRVAYGIKPLLDAGFDGSGRTIAIIDAYGSPTLASDLATWENLWGLPHADLTVVAPFGIAPTDPGNAAGWAGETSLDVEWAHAVAPGAKILLIVARSNNDSDILDATQWLADHDNADVLSQSYGEGEACMGADLLARQHRIFDQLSKQKITLFASSGDQGAGIPTCDGNAFMKATSTPASDPDVTGVGGTTLVANGLTGVYGSESVWNETLLLGGAAAGGSGISSFYSRPDYQAPVVKDTKMRVVPDISYNAAVLEGVITRWNGAYYRFGGTSAGSPQWAGLVAIADQMAGGRVGAINKTLYFLGKKAQTTYYHDVNDGSDNGLPDFGPGTGTPIDGYVATDGFDFATGWGSPIANALLPAIAKPGNG